MSEHWVYLLRCADETYYAGYTTDIERRLAEHNDGVGAKYTRGRTPVELVYCEQYESRSVAQAREYELKSLTRAEKHALAED